MKNLGKLLYVLVAIICLGIGGLVYDNNVSFKAKHNGTNFGDQGIGESATRGVVGSAIGYPVRFHGMNSVRLSGLSSLITLTYKNNSDVIQSNVLKLAKNVQYTVSFSYVTKGKNRDFHVDLFPDTLPQEKFTATKTVRYANWQVSSKSEDMTRARLRFFDDISGANDKDITISDIRLYSVSTDMNQVSSQVRDGNKKIGKLPTLYRYGYKFLGWYTEKTGGTEVTENTILKGDMDLYPRWQAIIVKSIKINEQNVSILKGTTKKLNVTFDPVEVANSTITWKTSNEKLATISKDGVVKGIKAGTVTITATSNNGKVATSKVTITRIVNTITIAEKKELGLTYNAKEQTKAFPSATNAKGKVTYKIESQKNSSGQTVKYFSIPNAAQANIKTAGKTPAGKYTIVVAATADGNEDYEKGIKKTTITVTIKNANPITIAGTQKVSYTYSTAQQDVGFSGAQKAQGTVTYEIASQKNAKGQAVTAFTLVNKNSTKLRMAKNTTAGTYTVEIKATAAGNTTYNSKTVVTKATVTVGKAKNPMTIGDKIKKQSWKSEKICTVQYFDLAKPTSAQGNIEYTIKSQIKDKKNVSVFSIPDKTKNKIKMVANAATGIYTVTINAKALGNTNYNAATEVITLNVSVVKKEANRMTVTANQSWSTTYSNSALTKNFTAAKTPDGAVSYTISAQTKNNKAVKAFTIPSATKASLVMAKDTPVGDYVVTITAKAAGNDTRSAKSLPITMKVSVKKGSNTAPTLADTTLTYNGNWQFIKTSGGTKFGTVKYAYRAYNSTTKAYGAWSAFGTENKYHGTITPGKWQIKAKVIGDANHTDSKESNVATLTMNKAGSTLVFTPGNLSCKYNKNSTQDLSIVKATKNNGTLTYSIVNQTNSSGSKVSLFTIPDKAKPILRVAKGAATGTYKVTLRASDAGNSNYNSKNIDKTVTVTVSSDVIKASVEIRVGGNSYIDGLGQSVLVSELSNVSVSSSQQSTWNKYKTDRSIIWKVRNTKETRIYAYDASYANSYYIVTMDTTGNDTVIIDGIDSKGSKVVELSVKAVPADCTVTFSSPDTGYSSTKKYKFGDKIGSFPALNLNGDNLLYWYKNDYFGERVTTNTKVTNNVTIVAKIEKILPNSYKVPSGYSTYQTFTSDTLKYKTIKHNTSNKYYAIVWVKDAYKQLNSANNNLNGGARQALLNGDINNNNLNLKSKGMIATNGSYTISKRSNLPVIATRGTLTVNDRFQIEHIYYTISLGSDNILRANRLTDSKTALSWLKGLGARNTWAATHFNTDSWNGGRDGGADMRTSICQVDTNNFILYTGYSLGIGDYMKELHDMFGCNTVINLDGGGSTGMYYKTRNMERVGVVYEYKKPNEPIREIGDMIYFVE